MKKPIISLLLVFLAVGAFAQSSAVLNFHERFKNNGKYLSVRIEGGLLKILSNIETDDEDAQDMIKVLSKLESIDLHAIDKNEKDFNSAYVKDFKNAIKKEKYEELMIVRDGDTKVDFLVKEKKGKISDLLMVIDENNEFVLLSFSGEIDLQALARLSGELDIKGAKHLRKMEEQE